MRRLSRFLPLVIAEGMMGKLFGSIGVPVVFCLFFSLVESQLILPAHLGHHVRIKAEAAPVAGTIRARWKRIQGFMASSLTILASKHYLPALDRAIHWRYATLSACVVLLAVSVTLISVGRDGKTDVNAADWAMVNSQRGPLRDVLEWYKDDHGEYPESLEALVPRYLSEIPTDTKLGKVFVYALTEKRYDLKLTQAVEEYLEESGLEDDLFWTVRHD